MTEQMLPEATNDVDDDDSIGGSSRLDDSPNESRNGISASNDDTSSDLTSGFTDALANFASHIPFVGRDAARTIRNAGAAALKIEAKFPIIKSTIDRIASSIGYVESRNRYAIRGPVTKDGDRAYGQYQIMGKYVPLWTQQVLGRSMTPEEFLQNPAAQDAVARVKLGQIYQKYGNVGDVAAVWFSGRPLGPHNTSHDVTGVSVPLYAQLASNRYEALTNAAQQASPLLHADNDRPSPLAPRRHDLAPEHTGTHGPIVTG